MSNKRKYFPNNWKAFANQPDNFFLPLPYDEFFKWKVMGWVLPSSVSCIIREEKDGKVSEKIYSQSKSAKKYLDKQMKSGAKTVYTICDDHSVQVLRPEKKPKLFQDGGDSYVLFEDEDLFMDEEFRKMMDYDPDDEDLFDDETGNYED
tara:strand:+ start:70 stop:516 length:447 start_codon:yes stop_codon:yes gene_type:complete